LDLPLEPAEVRALRLAGCFDPSPSVRRRCAMVLSLSRGTPVAVVARAYRLSRPTVYRYAKLYRTYRIVRVLETGTGARYLRLGGVRPL
jgi:hypothetical protein